MPRIYTFDSMEDLLASLRKDQEAADERAKTHPVKIEDLKHGDICVSPRPDFGVTVFGEVWEYSEKYPEDNPTIQQSRRRGYIYGRFYSALCPEGEVGSTHITTIVGTVPREVFERAKANGFRHLEPLS